MSDSATISPTAHYTGYVWARNGLSHPGLSTTEGRVLFDSLHPLMVASARFGRPSLESYLLARHLAIDALLQRAIERDGITQVLEVAAGLRRAGGDLPSATASASPISRPICPGWPPASAGPYSGSAR